MQQVQSVSAGDEDVSPSGDQDGRTGLSRIAGALYEKYVRRHSELEINISSMLRNRWEALDDLDYPQNDLLKIVQIVDEVISEMYFYMKQSFLRFDIQRK